MEIDGRRKRKKIDMIQMRKGEKGDKLEETYLSIITIFFQRNLWIHCALAFLDSTYYKISSKKMNKKKIKKVGLKIYSDAYINLF